MDPKPKHLGPEYAAQFEDLAIARAYYARPPYPAEIGTFVASLVVDTPRRVLELGAGSGDLTYLLAPHVAAIEAVEPSAAMLQIAHERTRAENVCWVQLTAESHAYRGPYAAVVAAESLHWMDWERVFPAIATSLSPRGRLILVVGARRLEGLPWERELGPLIARHSTNQDYRAYDLVQELVARKLFEEYGHQQLVARRVQSVTDYIESFHSRNGFSRERMRDGGAAFDAELAALVRRYSERDSIEADVRATVVWGIPQLANR